MSRRNKSRMLKRKKKGDRIILFFLMYLFTLFCAIHSARQYNNFTIVKFPYIICIFFLSGFFFGAVTYQYEKRFQGVGFKAYDHFVLSLLMYGSISCSAFFVLNEYFSSNKEYKQTVLILEKHEQYKRSPNYIVVAIEGEERDINISDKDFQEISLARSVDLKLQKGLFGFLLIKEVKLKY